MCRQDTDSVRKDGKGGKEVGEIKSLPREEGDDETERVEDVLTETQGHGLEVMQEAGGLGMQPQT